MAGPANSKLDAKIIDATKLDAISFMVLVQVDFI
jgi:hypothetical protein